MMINRKSEKGERERIREKLKKRLGKLRFKKVDR